jgi:hypothetical protein
MNPRMINVKPMPNYHLLLELEGNINRVFDVQWNDEIDFCSDTLFLDSKPC